MLYHEDWFMRQVQMMVSFLIRFLAGDKEEIPRCSAQHNRGQSALPGTGKPGAFGSDL